MEESFLNVGIQVVFLSGSDSLAQSQIRASPCRSTKDFYFRIKTRSSSPSSIARSSATNGAALEATEMPHKRFGAYLKQPKVRSLL